MVWGSCEGRPVDGQTSTLPQFRELVSPRTGQQSVTLIMNVTQYLSDHCVCNTQVSFKSCLPSSPPTTTVC
jgi:hypothetical protein